MKHLILIIILSASTLHAQEYPFTPERVLWNISPYEYHPDPAITPCPWQSWRLLGYQSFQIDLLLTDQESKIIEGNHMHLIRDMRRLFNGAGYDELEVVQMGYRYKVHNSGLPYEPSKFGYRDYIGAAIDPTIPNPYAGWLRKTMADGRTIMAAKQINDDLVQLSVVWFLDL